MGETGVGARTQETTDTKASCEKSLIGGMSLSGLIESRTPHWIWLKPPDRVRLGGASVSVAINDNLTS